MKKVCSLATAVVLMAGTAFAAGPGKSTAKTGSSKKTTRLTEVRICPISQTPVTGKGAGNKVVGKYKVFFC